MAALMAGVQYGLSSHSNFYANKDVIFVKLTDSAQRAIEDYARNLNFSDEKPTIQFLGNEGKLNFPTSHGTAGFTFSLSNNHDMEGPQGAFECVQQTGPKSLESLGTLPCKMRIHANDDVYEKTRHRMAAVEENNKNKCTRVIKANGPDIGRKVKVKASVRTVQPPVKAKTSESSIPRAMIQSSRLNYSTSSMPPSSSSSMSLSSTTPAQKSAVTNNNPPARTQPNKKISELMRRPLKERLIHVLALRPYKKPELFDRIQKEGMKEREKSMMTTILKQIAQMRDNTYQLHRHVWNEVQEDWQFYTEQERAMLKRKKPQNLTPPGTSSDGSGHSPNSVHPGSPPGIVAPAPGYMSSKRPGYYEGSDGIQTKRPRISHYRKPEANSRTALSSGQTTSSSNHSNSSSMNSAPQVIVHDSNSNNWDNQRQNPRDYRSERTANSDVLRSSYNSISKSCKTPTSDCEIDNSMINSNSTQSSTSQLSVFNIAKHNSHSSLSRHHSNANNGDNKISSANERISTGVASAASSVCAASPVENLARRPREIDTANSARQRADRERERERIRETREIKQNHVASNSYDNHDVHSSTNSNAEYHHAVHGNTGVAERSVSQVSPETSERRQDYEDLETLYPPITCLAQRRQYTALFTADYEEYRKLYVQLEEFSNLFNKLKARYVEAEAQGLTETCKEIRREIEIAFYAVKADPAKYAAKKRFDYLHVKLSHLQKQVEAYDRIYPYADDDDNNIMNGYGLEY